MTSENGSSFKLPDIDSLPGPQASFRDIGRFLHDHDPTLHFHKLWGDDYRENVQALWQRLNGMFKKGEKPVGHAEELLMGMNYDWVMGPYLGVPESKKQEFLEWLLAGVRDQLEDQA